MAPLPTPPQQPPRRPVPLPTPMGVAFGATDLGLNPFTQAQSDLISQRRLNLQNSFDSLFGQPVPEGTPGGAFRYDMQQTLGSLASPFYGLQALNLDAQKGFVDAGREVGNYFTGTNFKDPRTNPDFQASQPLPGMPELMKAQIAQAVNPNEVTLGQPLSPLDGVMSLPGAPLPQAPKRVPPPDFKPDFSKADIRLDAAKPTGKNKPQGDRLSSFLEGAAIAAGGIDPSTPWATALTQAISGGVQGQRDLRLRQEEAELKSEAEMRQYELMRAGIDADRASAEAQMAYNRTKLEMDAYQQNFENEWKMASALQPNVSANSDGSMIITQRMGDGSMQIKKVGFEDALRAQLAVAQARAVSGKSGEYALKQRLLKTAGPEMALGMQVNEAIGLGMDSMLLPVGSPAYEKYVADTAAFDQQLAAQGLPDKMLMARSSQEKFQRLMQLIYANSQVRDHALHVLFGVQPAAPPERPVGK